MNRTEKGLVVQRTQLNDLEIQSEAIEQGLSELESHSKREGDTIEQLACDMGDLNYLLNELIEKGTDFSSIDLNEEPYDLKEERRINDTSEKETRHIRKQKSAPIHFTDAESYEKQLDLYIQEHQIILTENPIDQLLTQYQQREIIDTIHSDYKYELAKCDKYDYIMATFSGVVAGLMDIFLVGSPEGSKLLKWTDEKVDNTVVKFAQFMFKMDKEAGANVRKKPDGIASAIGYLEKRFRVNYDARYASDLQQAGSALKMGAKNHHLKSLGHSPDIVGLFFSVLDQFTGKASFISDGKVLRLEPVKDSFELKGDTFIAKLFAGFSNWFGHLLSDIAGSSGTRGHLDGRRGAGIPIPFYNLFQLCDFGSLPIDRVQKTVAEFSVRVYEAGYDARFGLTLAIPVLINELTIKLLWSFKRFFYHKKPIRESLPIGNQPELQRMLVVGYGTLCLMDATDAAIRSKGQALLFATRLNVVAWVRFSWLSFREVNLFYLSKSNQIDRGKLEKDLDKEWERLKNSL